MKVSEEKSGAPREHSGALEDISAIRTYVSVVETHGISAAARRLHLTPSTVSKHVSLLEERLGARLINRTTRRLSVTDVGSRLYERALKILQELEAAEAEIFEFDKTPRGTLRVTAPPIMAARHLAPHLPKFLRRYPEISLELNVSAKLVDLVNEGTDLAIRVASDVNRHMQAVRLAPIRRVLCVSPDYIERYGAPESPDELTHHNCLLRQASELVNKWTLKSERGVHAIRVDGKFTADNAEVLRDAVVGGVGVALMPTFVCWQDLLAGRLLEILPGSTVIDTWLYAVVPHRGPIPSKTRSFIEFAKEVIGDPPHWDAALTAYRPSTINA